MLPGHLFVYHDKCVKVRYTGSCKMEMLCDLPSIDAVDGLDGTERGYWKRISKKRMKNQAKTDKTEHGMEKRGKDKVKSKPMTKKSSQSQKVNPDKSQSQERSRNQRRP
ncbi:hypothetical protein Tco_0648676 [Tanacetum coccineum]